MRDRGGKHYREFRDWRGVGEGHRQLLRLLKKADRSLLNGLEHQHHHRILGVRSLGHRARKLLPGRLEKFDRALRFHRWLSLLGSELRSGRGFEERGLGFDGPGGGLAYAPFRCEGLCPCYER